MVYGFRHRVDFEKGKGPSCGLICHGAVDSVGIL